MPAVACIEANDTGWFMASADENMLSVGVVEQRTTSSSSCQEHYSKNSDTNKENGPQHTCSKSITLAASEGTYQLNKLMNK